MSPSESTSPNSFSSIEGTAAAILFARVPRQENRGYNLPMKHSDFVIGGSFWCGGREWRVTDIGARTIIAICLDETEVVISSRDPAVEDTRRTLSQSEAKAEGWFNGPPYTVAEHVFDEYDQHPCAFDAEGTGEGDGETPAGTSVRGPYSTTRKILRARRDAARALEAASAATESPTDQV